MRKEPGWPDELPGDSYGTIVTKAATRRAGGPWHQPVALTARSGLYPDVAMAAAGDAVAVWQGPRGDVVTASWPARASRWSAARVLYRGNPGVDPYPEVAAGARGEAIAVWTATRSAPPCVPAVAGPGSRR